MKQLSVGFLGFHQRFNRQANHVTMSLGVEFDVSVSAVDASGHLDPVPEVLFTSTFERSGLVLRHRFAHHCSPSSPTEVPLYADPRYDKCIKIFTSDECARPPWDECDYAMTSDFLIDDRHLRLPIYVHWMRHFPSHRSIACRPNLRTRADLVKDPAADWEAELANKSRFCAFVQTNQHCPLRNCFYDLLAKYKTVDSGGGWLNNLGYQVSDKLDFLPPYKFTMAFENHAYLGYVSEKIVEPMLCNSIPIYWGCPRVVEEFNPRSFVVATGRRLEDVVEEVAELDRDDAAYVAKLREPWWHGNVPNRYVALDLVCRFVTGVLERPGRRSST